MIGNKREFSSIFFAAAAYGLISISMAFVIGRLGTVLQASQVLSGSVGGPLLALFTLGLFFPSVNAKVRAKGKTCN